jgi:hypothetical protein
LHRIAKILAEEHLSKRKRSQSQTKVTGSNRLPFNPIKFNISERPTKLETSRHSENYFAELPYKQRDRISACIAATGLLHHSSV